LNVSYLDFKVTVLFNGNSKWVILYCTTEFIHLYNFQVPLWQTRLAVFVQ